MATPISQIRGIALPEPIQSPQKTSGTGEFQNLLERSIQRVEGLGSDAATAIEKLVSGESEELHSAVLAAQRADLAFDLTMQIRNKVVQAYQEVMRMQL